MQHDSIWHALRRFGVEALCVMMLLYGPPLQALQGMAPPPGSTTDGTAPESAEDDGLWATLGEGVESTVEVLGSTVAAGVDQAKTVAGQPWTDALAVLLATGAGDEPPVELLTDAVTDPRFDAVPPLPPGFNEPAATAARRAGIPGIAASPEALLAARDHLESIPLLPGWNLLSIPEEPVDPAPAAVLAPLAGSFDRVFAYDACDPADPWKLYDPADAAASDLLDLDPTQGFWIDALGATSLPSVGTLASTTSWQLCTGWNLIGYPAGEARHLRNVLQSIEGKYIRAFGFDLADPTDPWEIWDIGVPDWANDLVFLRPGFGYWVLVTEDVTLTIANEGDAPTVAITAPSDLDIVTEPTEIRGTVESALLDRWTLDYRLVGEPDWIELARGNFPVSDTSLATFDPTLLLNGLYEIRLEAIDLDGRAVEETISINVEGNMKIGHFSVSFVDLQVPLSGLDIELVRTYDTRQRQIQGDFGQGWTLDIRQGSYRNNRPPGDGWQILNPGGPLGLPCTDTLETKSHVTTIRLSDREVYRFRTTLEDAALGGGGCFATAAFAYLGGPLPGATLEVLGNDQVFYANASDEVIDTDTLAPFIPRQVRLTTRDGRVFDLDLEAGVTRLADANDNELLITPDGITHSNGVAVDFERDADGRIVAITDPMGNTSRYVYDAGGDLVTFEDRASGTTRFVYNDDHFLRDMINPLGVRASRNEYDDEGRLVRVIDANGNAMEMTHDLGSRREVVTDRLGQVRILEYDSRGNVLRQTDETGQTFLRTYDGLDQQLTETNPLGHTETYTWVGSNLTAIQDANGNTTQVVYDSTGRPTRVTDPLGNESLSEYDDRNNLIKTTDALGNEVELTYDRAGNLETRTDSLGNVTSYAYTFEGHLRRESDAAGRVIDYTYDANGNQRTRTTARTTPSGVVTEVTRFEFDALDRQVKVTRPDGTVVESVYDAMGRLTENIDALGRSTRFTYDTLDRLVTTSFADGTTEQREYDAEGRLVRQIDPGGRQLLTTYDAVGRQATTTFPDGSTVRNVYDAAGRAIELVDRRGFTTRFAYDPRGSRTQITDALGASASFGFDIAGRVTTRTTRRGGVLVTEFDAVGQPTKVTYPDGSTNTFRFDANGLQIAAVDADGAETLYGYDGVGQLISITDPLGGVASYGYDEQGNRVRQTDANGNTTRFEFDSLGRMTRKIYPDGVSESFGYDAVGNLVSWQKPDGTTVTHTYDARDRLVEQSLPDGSSFAFTYTATGQRATVVDSRGTTSYTYDSRDRVAELTYPDGRRLAYSYDANDNRTSTTAHFGSQSLTTSMTWDALNRPLTATDPNGGSYQLTYDAAGNRTALVYPNGVRTDTTFDLLDRPTLVETVESVSGTVLQSYALTLSDSGRRLQVDELGGVRRAYDYDLSNRLTGETVTTSGVADAARTFEYDAVGNRLRQTLSLDGGAPSERLTTYDVRDRVVTDDGVALTWDANGNLVARGSDQVLGWNALDQLESVTLADGTVVEHTYDFDGNRVRTTTTPPGGSAEVVDYLVDPLLALPQVVAETDGSGALQRYHVGLGAEVLATLESGGDHFLHADFLGSTRLLTDSSAAVTDRYTYSAFGELTEHTGSSENAFLFAGEPRDSTTGLDYLRARWMDPGLGRFVSADPFPGFVRDPRSLHPYLYGHADPVNMTDPTGNFSVGVAVVAVVIVSMLAAFPLGAQSSALSQPRGRKWTASDVRSYGGFVEGIVNLIHLRGDKRDCADLAIDAVITFADRQNLHVPLWVSGWKRYINETERPNYKLYSDFARTFVGAQNLADRQNSKSIPLADRQPGDFLIFSWDGTNTWHTFLYTDQGMDKLWFGNTDENNAPVLLEWMSNSKPRRLGFRRVKPKFYFNHPDLYEGSPRRWKFFP